jgi:hypothetical protein
MVFWEDGKVCPESHHNFNIVLSACTSEFYSGEILTGPTASLCLHGFKSANVNTLTFTITEEHRMVVSIPVFIFRFQICLVILSGVFVSFLSPSRQRVG